VQFSANRVTGSGSDLGKPVRRAWSGKGRRSWNARLGGIGGLFGDEGLLVSLHALESHWMDGPSVTRQCQKLSATFRRANADGVRSVIAGAQTQFVGCARARQGPGMTGDGWYSHASNCVCCFAVFAGLDGVSIFSTNAISWPGAGGKAGLAKPSFAAMRSAT